MAVEIILSGFRTIVVSVNAKQLTQNFIGRIYDQDFVDELNEIEGVDVCAELGEFHTYVFDGPNFSHPVAFQKGAVSFRNNHWFLEIS